MMAYFSSFDTTKIGASTLTLSTSGKSNISVTIASMQSPVSLGETANNTVFNHVVSRDWVGVDSEYNAPLQYYSYSFLYAIQFYLQAAATTASWTSPSTLTLALNTTTWLLTFSYPSALTGITFGNTETRRLFGFAGNFSGSSTGVSGSEVPKYIIVPTIDGASMATPIFEQDADSSAAYSGGGRFYGVSRSGGKRMRDWTQQFQSKASTFRRFAAAAPNEFTFQDLFEHCRTGYPFGVYAGFGDNQYEAYAFRDGSDSFHPTPATPGNADQFHIPFRAYALGRSS